MDLQLVVFRMVRLASDTVDWAARMWAKGF